MAISSNEGYISIEFGTIHMGWAVQSGVLPGTAPETMTSPPSSH